MSLHINATQGAIAKNVLLAGDPLRAKYIAEKFLQNALLVSQTRNIFYFTGTYKSQPLTVGASGMGCASIGIYSYELYTDFNVDCIIRIGTCGAYTTDLKLLDVLNVNFAASESTYAKYAWGIEDDAIAYQGNAFEKINETAATLNIPLQSCAVHSSDTFYRSHAAIPLIAAKNNCPAVEMEAFALFANARHLKKTAATLLTVSDILPTHENITADQRETGLLPMINIALETIIR